MKRIILLLAALVLTGPACAADVAPKPLIVKSVAPAAPCTVTDCRGPYGGINLSGLNSNLDVIGSGIGGSFGAGGTMLGAHLGYQAWNGKWFGAVEVSAAYDLTQNAGNVGFTDKLLTTEVVKFGGALGALLGGLGFGQGPVAPPAASQGPIPFTVPASLADAIVSTHLIVGAAQRHSKNGIVTGAGIKALLSANFDVGIDYMHIKWGGGNVTPAAALDTDDIVRALVSYHFN